MEKKTYEVPNLQVVYFEVEENTMSIELPSGDYSDVFSEGTEDGW